MENGDYGKPWYHGSPAILDELTIGSTITQSLDLARIFSHKPSIVAKDETGAIFHNGKNQGYMYAIDETVTANDVYPHPDTTMEAGDEWLIRRPLKVRKLAETNICPKELLSDEEEKSLMKKLKRDRKVENEG